MNDDVGCRTGALMCGWRSVRWRADDLAVPTGRRPTSWGLCYANMRYWLELRFYTISDDHQPRIDIYTGARRSACL